LLIAKRRQKAVSVAVSSGFREIFLLFEPAKNIRVLQNETGVFYPLKSDGCTNYTHEKGDNN